MASSFQNYINVDNPGGKAMYITTNPMVKSYLHYEVFMWTSVVMGSSLPYQAAYSIVDSSVKKFPNISNYHLISQNS